MSRTTNRPARADAHAEPVGQGDYIVKPGDCMASIANETGHFWETIWDDDANSELREVRQNPNILHPDDRVTIPEIHPKQESGDTEMRHRFVRRGEPVWLRVHLRTGGQPLANEAYTLEVGDRTLEGTTDPNGLLEQLIPPGVKRARLHIRRRMFELRVGHLNPLDSHSGLRGRLNNLGYDAGTDENNDELDEPLRRALRAFQRDHDLTVTGEPDDATRNRLSEEHEV